MALAHSDILTFFIGCVEAESSESFSLPRNKKSVLFLNGGMEGIKNILNGEVKYFIIQQDTNLIDFLKYRSDNKKNDKIFLSLDLIPKKDRYGDSLLPLYITEVMVEDIQATEGKTAGDHQEIRISTIDVEPIFNHNLLSRSMTIHDRYLLMDEIFEEQGWNAKKQLYLNHLDENISKSIVSTPVLFLSSDLHAVQSSTIRELDWIKNRFLENINATSLGFVLNRKINGSPRYDNKKYLEIFPLNQVQRDVVRFAMDNPFTVITGPPGTGKSQVVLNLLANIYINEKTVLFASKNNKAVNTVIEKLGSIQDGLCPFIRLGNKQEKRVGLQKILSGVDDALGSIDKPVRFSETDILSKEIDESYRKIKTSEKKFHEYCSTVREICRKIKKVPPHLTNSLYEGST
ncbi:AAA domain-containing protein, partial [Desulfosarcina sp.]|nr:AAA domain-containing protein [Desulfosarcina sp.]